MLIIFSPFDLFGAFLADIDYHNFSKASAERAAEFSDFFAERARELGCHFLDAALYAEPGLADGVHLDAQNHMKLAEAIYKKTLDILET